ncbi:MAG TPA: alpha/beta fold hydrolase [Longimicrobiales bacterium]|nr:alpha/beta fold hydrolase [Longimicrobiales bacterium]
MPVILESARWLLSVALVSLSATAPPAPCPQAAAGTDTATVILLHGLGRTTQSMLPMERALEGRGYRVVNLGYPSRTHSIAELVDTLDRALEVCCAGGVPVHFVTHSLGGILVRAYAARHGVARIGRVVMLSPPNAGSEVVDRLDDTPGLAWLLGPAFMQLGTDSTAVPRVLGPPEFEVGVITGEASLNPLFSWWLPGRDDGKVTVESARVDGAAGFLVVPYTHGFLMRREEVIEQVAAFLGTGRFADAGELPEVRR